MNVLLADKFAEEGVRALREAGCEVISDPSLDGESLRAKLAEADCEALVVRSTRVTESMLSAAPNLKLVIRAGAGYDTIDVEAASAKGIRVCNCPGKNSVAVAELTLGLMIALDRRLVDNTDDLRRGVWNKKEYSRARGLKGRTLGIVGLGRIGYEVAKRARAFEMNLLYHDAIERPDFEQELEIRRVSFDEILAESDFLTLHVPGGEGTRHMIGFEELNRMKRTAFVINCSRGGVVDEEALATAIEGGVVSGAALDVYEIEPAANDHEFKDPISQTGRVYGTHHIGASTEQAQCAVAEEAVRIIATFKGTGRLLNCVNPPSKAPVG